MSGTFARHTRLRRSPALRSLLRETRLDARMLIAPLFVTDDESLVGVVEELPAVRRHSVSQVTEAAAEVVSMGVGGILLFGVPAVKDEDGSGALASDGVVARAIRAIRSAHPELVVISDVCRCQFVPGGGCGIVRNGRIDTETTNDWLARASLTSARAGATLIAPSGMIDGGVRAIRAALDSEGETGVGILSYAVKHASALYGPFRAAVGSRPAHGDRRAHQLDPANAREAMREAGSDLDEGADIIMVKPALTNLDTLVRLGSAFPNVPLAAFEVSGEFAMLRAAAERGWLDQRAAALETLTAIVRAGADIVVTYRAVEVARWLREDRTS